MISFLLASLFVLSLPLVSDGARDARFILDRSTADHEMARNAEEFCRDINSALKNNLELNALTQACLAAPPQLRPPLILEAQGIARLQDFQMREVRGKVLSLGFKTSFVDPSRKLLGESCGTPGPDHWFQKSLSSGENDLAGFEIDYDSSADKVYWSYAKEDVRHL